MEEILMQSFIKSHKVDIAMELKIQSTRFLEMKSVNLDKTSKFRSGELIFISLVLLSLLGAVVWGYFNLWNVPPNPPLTVTRPTETPSPQWKLVFDDEFNGASLDTNKWNIEDKSVDGYHNCCLNYGLQYFTPEALSFQQGSLRITTQAQNVKGYHYTSGAITTEDKFGFTYGRIEFRARLPQTKGSWPAFWLLPVHTVGRATFEIDMTEMVGRDPNTVHMVNHWGTQQDAQDFTGPDFSQDYHVFSMIWTSQSISWYIDGVQRFESEQGISNQSMYLIINSTLGGAWAGNPDASTVLPQYMDIDYVRIYQSL